MPYGTHHTVPDARNERVRIWINGRLIPREEARISVFDSAYLVGDGIWEGMRLHQGVLLFLEDHLDRLFAGLAAVRMKPGLTRDQMIQALFRTVRANDMESGVHVRLMVSRGLKKTPSQDPRLTVSPANVVIIAEHKQADPEVRRTGISLHTSTVRRPPPETLDQRLNCHSKLHEVMALNEALAAGADEALMLDTNGHVATCNATNFFAVVDGEVWTSTAVHCLPGITRAHVIRVARESGVVVHVTDFSPAKLASAQEAFVTGTFGGLTPVRRIDAKAYVVPGLVTRRLTMAYEAALEHYAAKARHA
ncbi:MAG: aminotransferase class IV [Rhodothermales bacterium]|nr:aminotransferase class IV [Rhodothermales bacterium]MBO6781120.1 aminotransferase class IV [Rhodothermales bacterium]